MRVALLLLSICFLAAPARADESAKVTAAITTYSMDSSSLTADSKGRCWMGRTRVDCLTQAEYNAAQTIEVAYYVSAPTVQQKPLPPLSVKAEIKTQ